MLSDISDQCHMHLAVADPGFPRPGGGESCRQPIIPKNCMKMDQEPGTLRLLRPTKVPFTPSVSNNCDDASNTAHTGTNGVAPN